MTANGEFDIAIVGMSCRFPGARTLDAYWRNLAAGVESITRLSDEEILESGVSAALLAHPAYVKAAPVLDEPAHFDAGFFGYSPAEASAMDPQQRLLLELAHEALENAGYDPERSPERVGVFAGSALNTYFTATGLNRRLTDDYIPTLIGNDKDFLSTRVSYKLNLRGPSLTVQTACSTSLVAVHLARQSLLSEETDMALAGAVSIRVPHRAGYICDGGGVTSPDGHVRAFDASANGTVFGSGGGVLVLKRLTDARADGDFIHAVIKGSAVNNDGSAKAGYTAPSVRSQADAVVEALANAGVDADTISYVEAHGSGTPVGDPIEVAALTTAFRTFTERSGFCAIGSAKTNVGHLDAAAGVAGIIKTVLALQHRKLPPTVHYAEPNPEIDFPRTPFYVNARLEDWRSAGPRRAGVMATGMGGTNAHLVLEEAPERTAAAAADAPPHVLVLSAKSEAALDDATQQLGEFLGTNDAVSMNDVAFTLQSGRRAHAHRRVLVCTGRDDAAAALGERPAKRLQSGRADDARRPVILMLPGVGDHYVGMAHDLYERASSFRADVDRCAHILEPHLGVDIRNVLYPVHQRWKQHAAPKGIDLKKMLGRSADTPADADTAMLNETRFAHPALFTIEYATARLWQSLGVQPDAIVGHSMGEYVAACLAGVLSLDDALRLIAVRAKLVSELPQGAMLAVTLPERDVVASLPSTLSISLINGPSLCVVAGPPADVAEYDRALTERGVITRHVQNAHAFHSRMLAPVVESFEDEVKRVRLNAPAIPYISNVTGTWITAREATSASYWATHTTQTARFSDALRAMWQHKNATLIEAGPGRTLGVLATQHPEHQNGGHAVVLSSIRHHYESRSDTEYLVHAVGRAWTTGHKITWDAVPGAESGRRVPLPTYPFERRKYWLAPVSVPDAAAMQPSVRKNPRPGEWLYAPSWKRTLSAPLSARAPETLERDGIALVFADECGLTTALSQRLAPARRDIVTVRRGTRFENAGARSFTIDPANAEHYDRLIFALQANRTVPSHIIHAWSVSAAAPPSEDGASFAVAQDTGFFSLIHLARALAAHNVRDEVALFVVSGNAHDVSGAEPLDPGKATVLGPCMVIRQEYPNLRVRNIDVDVPWTGETDALADLIAGEMLELGDGMFVAYRSGQRWVQTYERVAAGQAQLRRATFRERGVYLITGGLGKIGLAISEYLATKYHARLVLVGRSAAPERLRQIEALGGEAIHIRANVADAAAMTDAVAQARRRFGKIHGVIHAAGIVGEQGYREIKDSTVEFCDGHFQAKVHGLRTLDRVLAGQPLDFCLLMSSLTAVLGGIGQTAYASANLYMDALARAHNRASRVPWMSVNWDVWRLDADSSLGSGLGATLKDLGMEPAEAMATLETVLSLRPASQIVVSTGDLGARIDQWIKLESLANGAVTTDASARQLSERPNLDTAFEAPTDDTERRIARIWENTLGIEPVGINDGFAELGGHSLLAVRVVSEMRSAFQLDLPMRVLFDAPTIAALSRHVEALLVAEIEAMSDAEARQLVSSL